MKPASFFFLVFCLLLAACSPSSDQLTAAAVVAQAQTQTAAPTLTPTTTPSPLPSNTPTPEPTLTNTPSPTATPFGGGQGHIAFVSSKDGNDEIYVINSDGSNLTNLTNNPANDNYPSYSPDGKLIAFISDRDGNRYNVDLFVMNSDGTNLSKVTAQLGQIKPGSIAWSIDGQRLAILLGGKIPVITLDGKSKETINGISGEEWVIDSTSPDGKQTAKPCNSEWGDICLRPADAQEERNITNNPSRFPAIPSWSPDGTHLAFLADYGNGDSGIFTIKTDGTELIRLSDFPLDQLSSGFGSPSW